MPASPRIRAVTVTAAVATALTLGFAGVAFASDGGPDPVPCSDIAGKGALLDVAGNVLDIVDLNLSVLGGDKQTTSCDPPAKNDDKDKDKPDDPSCDDFDTQADAQEALDDDADLAEFLDRDGDGVACESLFDDNDASNDDDDSDHDKDKDKDKDKKTEQQDDKSDGGQVKVHPKGGVDTGGFAV